MRLLPSSPLLCSLTLSLLGHLLLFLAVPEAASPSVRRPGLQVVLLDAGEVGLGSQQAAREAGAARRRHADPGGRGRPRAAVASPASTTKRATAAARVEQVVALPAPAGREATPAVANPGTPQEAAAGGRAEAGEGQARQESAPQGKEGVDADALRAYQFALAQQARQFRRYPPLARERSWEGRVRIGVYGARGAGPPRLRLLEGSGYALLDEQALAMMREALLRTPLPEGLHGRSFELVLPVEFSLEQP